MRYGRSASVFECERGDSCCEAVFQLSKNSPEFLFSEPNVQNSRFMLVHVTKLARRWLRSSLQRQRLRLLHILRTADTADFRRRLGRTCRRLLFAGKLTLLVRNCSKFSPIVSLHAYEATPQSFWSSTRTEDADTEGLELARFGIFKYQMHHYQNIALT